ncbi:T9SS type A sorting domain-containing protein [Flavobacterium ajazii]|uniref:T9SS type A sorting domain-containing protein n=1 Tax=Flavobacterium ajazii TaxID=2692318 RepID=UPI0013D27423|nr:T9SS type A sorting domain-containing protein [Flavobacterium ajazii]
MKNILLIFCLVFSVCNYGQQIKKGLLADLQSNVPETEDLIFKETVVNQNATNCLNIKNAVLDKVFVYDVLGKLQKTIVILTNKENHIIDLSQFSQGVYFIVLEKDNKTARRKIVLN